MSISRRQALAALFALSDGLALGSRALGATPALAHPPIVLGHRGAPALRPEHTLASYARAIADGADYVEPDLVPTRDGCLVARHECNITETTDIASRPEFASRRRTYVIEGRPTTGWFTVDLTLAELKSLRAIERIPDVRPLNTRYNGMFQVPAFDEILDFVAAESLARNRTVGVIPEIKNSTFFHGLGLDVEGIFVQTLQGHWAAQYLPLEIQSFEACNLAPLRSQLRGLKSARYVQLLGSDGDHPADFARMAHPMSYGEMKTPRGLAAVREYADAIGPDIRDVIPLDAQQKLGRPTALVERAHAADLLVHPWEFRPENVFLAADFRNDAPLRSRNPEGSINEIHRYLQEGIDGFFTDDPALGRAAVDGA